MRHFWIANTLAGVVFLTLAFAGWAAEEKKAAPPKQEKAAAPKEEKKAAAPKEEKMEKEAKAPARGSEDIKKVQEALKAKGQDPGPIDGIMGPKTQAALRAFQEANGLKPTGRLDDQTAAKLGVETPTTAKKKEAKEPAAKEAKKQTKEPMPKEKK
jgi:peptidoglycan hydrolase-like protein with peptidoglycan-binding domain